MKRTDCPQNCPNCNEGEITSGNDEYEGNYIIRRFICGKCDTKWNEQYKFEFWTFEK